MKKSCGKNKADGNKKHLPLSILCYSIVVFIWLGVCTANLVFDTMAKQDGSLQQRLLMPDAFTNLSMTWQQANVWKTNSEDPQMILDTQGEKVRSLHLWMTHSMEPYEIMLYYMGPRDEGFGTQKQVLPTIQEDGSYFFTLPRTEITAIRLDPASRSNVSVSFGDIVLNREMSPLSYFNPGWHGFIMLLLLPAFGTGVLRWFIDTVHQMKVYLAGQRWIHRKRNTMESRGSYDE